MAMGAGMRARAPAWRVGWTGLWAAALIGLSAIGLQGCAHQAGPAHAGDAATSDAADLRHRAQIRLELAANYLQMGRPQIALQEVQQALATDPGFADAYHLQGLVQMALGDLEQAQASLRRAQEMKPDDPDVMHNLGWLYCQRQQYAPANALFERALAVPTYASRSKTFLSQGVCLQRAGQLPQAEQALMHAYELDAGNPLAGFHLASVIFGQGDAKRAQFYIRRVNNGQAASADSLWLGVKVERALKDYVAMRQLGDQLTRRFSQSRQVLAFDRGAYDE